MNPTHRQTQSVQQFTCLGAECPDTCCAGWGMQVPHETIIQYQQRAPELLDSVTQDASGFVMKRNPKTSECVKFEQGLCAIQRDYSPALLGDACYFFPRITRALGTSLLTTMTLACPEAARLTLYAPDAFTLGERSEVRTPYTLRNYLPEGIDEEAGLTIHAAVMNLAADKTISPARALMRISAVAHALEMQPYAAWAEAFPLYIIMADGRIPKPEAAPTDLFNLAHALHGLVMASPAPGPRLMYCVETIAQMLGITYSSNGGIALTDQATEFAVRALATMRRQAHVLQPILRRYLQAQISQSFFPFSGLGQRLSERITIIGVRYATVRLALASLGDNPGEEEVIRIIQSLSRFSDHLADPTLSLAIYTETGWVREARLHAIIGD